MNKKLKKKQALIMAEPYRTPFNSKVAKVSGDVIEDSVGGIKYATSFDGATKIVDGNKNKIKIKDGVYNFGKSVNLIKFDDKEGANDTGITYSIKNGVITFSATPSETIRNMTFHFNAIGINVNDTYSIALFNQFTSPIGFFVQDKGNAEGNIYLGINENIVKTWTVTTGSQYEAIDVYLDKNKTYTNEVIKPILVSGSTIPTKYYSGSYGIKLEVVDGVVTCNGMIASDSGQTWWYNFEFPISSGIYSANIFLRSRNINVHLSQDLYDWSHSYQIATKEENTIPKSNINVKTDCKYMFFNFDREHDYENVILKPMLVLGTTAPTEFEPNFKNLLELENVKETTIGNFKYSIKNGITTINGTTDGTYSIIHYQNIQNLLEDGATYSFNDISNNNYFYMQIDLIKIDGTAQFLTKKDSFTWSTSVYSKCDLKIQSNNVATTFDNLEIKPTLVKSSIIPTQFIPFANPYFISLGQNGSVQYNGLEPREIDLKGNVISKINNQASDKLSNYALTKNTKVVDLGSLEWETKTTDTAGVFRMITSDIKQDVALPIYTSTNANILCTKYKTISGDLLWKREKGIAIGTPSGDVSIYDPEYNTSDKLEAFKKAIRGTLLMYQVKNPTTINTTSFKTFKEDTNATISDDNFASSPNVITETFKPTRSYDFKVNGFSNVAKSSNLFFLPNITSTTLLGLTYSASNQKMTIKGTATQQYIIVYSFDITDKMNVGKTYVLQCSSGNADLMLNANIKKSDDTEVSFSSYDNKKFTWTSDNTKIVLIIQTTIASGTTIDLSNITFGLYETDNVSIPYEPYFDPYIESFADKKNLLNPPYIESSTKNGVSVVNNNDGSFTFNGRATATSTFVIWGNYQLTRGTYYFKSNVDDNRVYLYNETANVYVWNQGYFVANGTDKYRIVFVIYEGVTVSNYITKPMLIQGKTAPTTFLPYQDKYSAFLNVKGKNFIGLDNQTLEINGIKVQIKDGVITVNGVSSDRNVSAEINLKNRIYSGTYSFNAFTTVGSRIDVYLNAPLVSLADLSINTTKTNVSLTSATQLVLYFPKGIQYDNRMLKPMLVNGSTAPTEFEPYYSFTKEVLIKQPLRKFDYLTYDGVYRQTNEITLDGSWNVVNNNYLFEDGRFVLNKSKIFFPLIDNWEQPFSQLYITTTSDLPLLPLIELQNQKKKGIALNNGDMIIKLDDSADNSLNNWTVEKINNYFKQNPITITYKTVDQTFEATSLTRLLFKNGYNKITAFDSINNNAIVEYLEYYKSK